MYVQYIHACDSSCPIGGIRCMKVYAGCASDTEHMQLSSDPKNTFQDSSRCMSSFLLVYLGLQK